MHKNPRYIGYGISVHGVCLPIWRLGMRARLPDGLGDVLIFVQPASK